MTLPTSSSDPDPAVVVERPRPARIAVLLPDPANTSEHPRRWRLVVVTEGGDRDLRDFTYVPVGESTWGDLPQPVLGSPMDRPEAARAVGTVERVWREPAPPHANGSQDAVWVWAEGILDPGESMPYPYARHMLWIDEIDDTAAKLRANADQISTKLGEHWRQQLADEMHCDPTDIGIGPLARRASGRRPTDTPIGPIVADLRFTDQRAAKLTLNIEHHDWFEAAAIPLDNPFAIERVARWRDQFTRTIEEPTPAVDRTHDDDGADNLRRRLDSTVACEPPAGARDQQAEHGVEHAIPP